MYLFIYVDLLADFLRAVSTKLSVHIYFFNIQNNYIKKTSSSIIKCS